MKLGIVFDFECFRFYKAIVFLTILATMIVFGLVTFGTFLLVTH